MRSEAQIARFWLLRRRVSQSIPKPVSTGVENGLTRPNRGMIGISREFEDVDRVAPSFPTYLGKMEVILLVGYDFLGLRKALLCVQRLIIIYKRRQSSLNSLTKFA